MNNLCTDIGYYSLNKKGENLCGDHVEVVPQEPNSSVVVLADGLGSGVKANILSTLTSKIISTMLAANMSIEECAHTIISTLPVCRAFLSSPCACASSSAFLCRAYGRS